MVTYQENLKNAKSRWATVQEKRHHPYFAEGRLTYPKSPNGTMWPAQIQAQLVVLLLKLCFADTGFLPLHQGIRGSFFSFTLFLHTFTFMLQFIALLVMGVIRVGCTCSSALLNFFIILLDTNSALWLGCR